MFYVNDVLQQDDLLKALSPELSQPSNWLVTTEVNFEGVLRKSAKTKGLLRIVADEIDTVLNESGKKDPAKLMPAHMIHVCDCSMPELGKELGGQHNVVSAPKVIVSVGDQPGEVSKYTPYTVKGESYRFDPVCGDIADALAQKRNSKKVDRSQTARYLSRRYISLATETATWASMELDEECRGVGNVLEETIKDFLGEACEHSPVCQARTDAHAHTNACVVCRDV